MFVAVFFFSFLLASFLESHTKDVKWGKKENERTDQFYKFRTNDLCRGKRGFLLDSETEENISSAETKKASSLNFCNVQLNMLVLIL